MSSVEMSFGRVEKLLRQAGALSQDEEDSGAAKAAVLAVMYPAGPPALTIRENCTGLDFPCAFCGDYFTLGVPWIISVARGYGDVCGGLRRGDQHGIADAVREINAHWFARFEPGEATPEVD